MKKASLPLTLLVSLLFVINMNGHSMTRKGETERITRLAKIVVDSAHLDDYNRLLKEEIEASMQLEAGVLALYAVSEKDAPNKITILEIYADEAAYQSHIKTAHFLKYKNGTQRFVQSLELINVDPLIPGLKMK